MSKPKRRKRRNADDALRAAHRAFLTSPTAENTIRYWKESLRAGILPENNLEGRHEEKIWFIPNLFYIEENRGEVIEYSIIKHRPEDFLGMKMRWAKRIRTYTIQPYHYPYTGKKKTDLEIKQEKEQVLKKYLSSALSRKHRARPPKKKKNPNWDLVILEDE